jgi:ribose 5-phosphate isomerase RpiB
MRIGIVSEKSTVARNGDIVGALRETGKDFINMGMTRETDPDLLYTHAGLVAALALNYDLVDFVIGGCGNGQGFMNAAMQFPNVFCGVIRDSLDAWLFAQINGGNCVSLVLGQGYGFASDIKLRFTIEKLFSVELGSGYPKDRKEPQDKLRKELSIISRVVHKSMDECLRNLDISFLNSVINYPNFKPIFAQASLSDETKKYLERV